MNDFCRLFLNQDWKAAHDAPRFYLCGFGKHPGWNDHLDDIGVATASLIEARRIIYGGIASQIESAAWEKAGPEKAAVGFNHVLHWRRVNETLTGLVWSSQDGKGRALYPMLMIAHSAGQTFDWVAGQVLPALEDAAARCRATKAASGVVEIFRRSERDLRVNLSRSGQPEELTSRTGVAEWAAHLAKEPALLLRVLHHLRVNLAPFAPGSDLWCEGETQARSCSLRLPQIPGLKPAQSLNAWMAFLATQIDQVVPMLGLLPVDGKWLDLIVGEPGPADFFALRALPAAVPLVTDIPYQIDPEAKAGWASIIADVNRGRLPETSCFDGESAETNAETAAKWLARFRPSDRTGFFTRFLNP